MTTNRIGRPPNQDGHEYRTIGVSGTPAEIAAVLELTPRERIEAMMEKIAAHAADKAAYLDGLWFAKEMVGMLRPEEA